MFQNKFRVAFFVLLSVNLIVGGLWLRNHPEYYRGFLPQRNFDFETEFPKQPEANYYGWIGADRVDLFIQYGSGDMFGGYYNDKSDKRVELSAEAITTDNGGKEGWVKGQPFVLEMELRGDSVNELKMGKIEITKQIVDGQKIDLSRGKKFLEAMTISGTFTPKSGLSQDVYLTQSKKEIEYWTSKPLKGKVYKVDNPERPTYFVDMGYEDGGQFFSYESWWFNQFKDGDEVIFNGKIREYANPIKYNGNDIKQGIFDIKSVVKE